MKSWLSSPLAVNYLLHLYKNGPQYQKKYLQIYKDLKNKELYVTSNHLFLSSSSNTEKQYKTSDITVQKIDFAASKNAHQCIMKWINSLGNFCAVDIEKHILPNTTSFLCNVSVFKGVWCNQSPVMKVHNSFSYTEDIRYDVRLIELPIQNGDFKLVIIVPNEVSSIAGLFSLLVDKGLTTAMDCVQPLFTFSTVLEAPSIGFNSEECLYFTENNCKVLYGAQIGNVQIDETGTNISVLTLLRSPTEHCTKVSADEQLDTESPFYFAVLYKDIAIFTGRYVNRVKCKNTLT